MPVVGFFSKNATIKLQNEWEKRLRTHLPSVKLVPLLSKEAGGDGDPLDVILIGSYIERGKVVSGKIIGVLKMLDGGEIDDKLLMIQKDSPLYKATNVEELKEQFPGTLSIIETWFESYKGPGEIKTNGYGSVSDAKKILDKSILEFKNDN